MNIQDKTQALYVNHRIVFYFDEDGTLKDELYQIEEAGIRLIEVSNNYFKLKYQLNTELKEDQVFLYHPFARPEGEALFNYPLLDLLKANVELRLDEASEFMSEFGLENHHLPLVKHYLKELKTKTNQRKLANILDSDHFSEATLKRGLISISLGFNRVESKNVCLAKWLSIADDSASFQKLNQQLEKLNLETELLQWIKNLIYASDDELTTALAVECTQKVKYNILTALINQPVKEDSYAPKFKFNRAAELNRIQAFVNDWVDHTQLKGQIEPIFNSLAEDIQIEKIVSWYGIEQEYGFYTESMFRMIVKGIYELGQTDLVKAKEESIRWRRSAELPETLKEHINFIYHYASVLLLLKEYTSFRFNSAEEFIDLYAKDLFKVDLHFRKAVLAYEKADDSFGGYAEDASRLFDSLNEKYDRFLIDLNVEWQTLLQEKDFDFKSMAVNRQFEFYKNEIESFDHKIAVIISDAFRYEIGHELYDELLSDSKNQLTIEPYLCSIPSYTNLGMSNLLPNKGIAVKEGKDDLVFTINGISTVSNKRGDVIKATQSDSNVVSAEQVLKTTKLDEGRAMFKSKVVYVYHDWVDAIGDKKGTERATFEASEKALDEIKRLIRKISGWNVKNILVTSDHGFLYNHNELKENQREVPPQARGYSISKSRFVIAEGFKEPLDGYVMNMSKTTNIDTDLKVAIPRAINRYRLQGNIGFQFSHGGGSLQELVIPVLKYYKHVKEVQKQVSFRRIDEAKEIRSGSVKIEILQDIPVSNENKSLEVIVGLYSDSHKLLSNEVTLHLSSTSANPKERALEAILTLTTKGSNSPFCYLKAFGSEDTKRLNPLALNDILTISSLTEKDEW